LFPGLLALASGLLVTGGLVAQNLYLGSQVSKQEQQLIETYSELYPSGRAPRNVAEVTSRLKSKMRGSSSSQANSATISHLALLESIAATSKQNNIKLIGFTFEGDQCDLVVNGSTVQNINEYNNNLSQRMTALGSQSVELTARHYAKSISKI